MPEFIISDSDFGIDITNSAFSVRNPNGHCVIDIDIRGDQRRYDEITKDEGSECSWTLYPPRFYVREFPGLIDAGTGSVTASLDIGELDKYDAAIYLIEHNAIDGVSLRIVPNRSLEVCGVVFLSGNRSKFSIKWVQE